MRVHLDTDLGGDIDDLCALAMLLRWPEPLEITGITVVGDTNGMRTGMVRRVLEIADRTGIPVAAGAETSGGYYPYELGLPDEARHWPSPIVPSPNPLEDAVALLKRSADLGATILGIGPLTNLRLLEEAHPGTLATTGYVQMGGYLVPPRDSYPQWTNEDDFNVQVDAASSLHVLTTSTPLLVPLSLTVETALRRSDLDRLRLRTAGPLGGLIARQAEEFAIDERMAERFGATCANVPADIINFQHDALACAIALGWRDGVTIEEFSLVFDRDDAGSVQARIGPSGRRFRVVTAIDGPRFNDFWLGIVAPEVTRAGRS